jgi:hypothetical protein
MMPAPDPRLHGLGPREARGTLVTSRLAIGAGPSRTAGKVSQPPLEEAIVNPIAPTFDCTEAKPDISVVVPLSNEEENIRDWYDKSGQHGHKLHHHLLTTQPPPTS